ncbi:MAG: 6-carboxytetrahydropterin synthase QueD [Gammaproteobacteria bacterium]|nr:6-carboxytetrahydropterin synthase QueD [Gammaproteobacteria bacterium]
MSALYTLKVTVDFAAAHILHNYPGACSQMHGHNWKVEVEVRTGELDEIGMGLDFKTIKKAARDLANTLDHRYLNDIPPFNEINPTAEHLAAWFYERLAILLNNERVQMHAVTLWETDRACVRYTETQSR